MIDPNARVEPSVLERLGTQAALLFCDSAIPLSHAVARVVKDTVLTTHHIRRIMEFANVKAYLTLYERKDPVGSDGNWVKYVTFSGGPALFEDIMRLLDQKAEEASMAHRTDYEEEPQDHKAAKLAHRIASLPKEKVASLELEDDEPPRVTIEGLYASLGSAVSKMDDEILKLANLVPEAKSDFKKTVKEAVLAGYSFGDIRKVASAIPDRDLDRTLNEVAFNMRNSFLDDDAILHSFEKVSKLQPVEDHPLAVKFAIWKEAKKKLATAQATKDILKKKQAETLRMARDARGL